MNNTENEYNSLMWKRENLHILKEDKDHYCGYPVTYDALTDEQKERLGTISPEFYNIVMLTGKVCAALLASDRDVADCLHRQSLVEAMLLDASKLLSDLNKELEEMRADIGREVGLRPTEAEQEDRFISEKTAAKRATEQNEVFSKAETPQGR